MIRELLIKISINFIKDDFKLNKISQLIQEIINSEERFKLFNFTIEQQTSIASNYINKFVYIEFNQAIEDDKKFKIAEDVFDLLKILYSKIEKSYIRISIFIDNKEEYSFPVDTELTFEDLKNYSDNNKQKDIETFKNLYRSIKNKNKLNMEYEKILYDINNAIENDKAESYKIILHSNDEEIKNNEIIKKLQKEGFNININKLKGVLGATHEVIISGWSEE